MEQKSKSLLHFWLCYSSCFAIITRCFGTSYVTKILPSSESSERQTCFISSILSIRLTYSVIKLFSVIFYCESTTDSIIILSVNKFIYLGEGL